MTYNTLPKEIWEEPAEFYCPVIASLVTGGSHLLCAMLERIVRDMGGQIAAMDTDSAMIVSPKMAVWFHARAAHTSSQIIKRGAGTPPSGRCLSLRWIVFVRSSNPSIRGVICSKPRS